MKTRKHVTVAILGLLLAPSIVLAGGPPWLNLPIDGVKAENSRASEDLIATRLGDRIWRHLGDDRAVRISSHANQWYMTFPMGNEVKLSDIEAVLKGTGLSIPREKLRLFGHVTLRVSAPTVSAPTSLREELIAELKTIDYLSVDVCDARKDMLAVSVDMPYPAGNVERQSVAWDKFERNDFASDPATKSEPAVTSKMLPGFDAVAKALANHGARLVDMSWSPKHGCRPLGCVVDPGHDPTTVASQSTRRQ